MCRACKGTGACAACDGSGKGDGGDRSSAYCGTCNGAGACQACGGRGDGTPAKQDVFTDFDSDDEYVDDARIRHDCEGIVIDLTEDDAMENLRAWSERSADFVEDMARRFIANDHWVPSVKQALWLSRLHVRVDPNGFGAQLLADLKG